MKILQNQYEFLYEVLFESFRGKSYTIPKEDLVAKVESQSTQDKAVNLSDFNKEFQVWNYRSFLVNRISIGQ